MANPACCGTLNVEVDVKSPAHKIWEALRDFIYIYPKAFPNDYESVEVLEGDGIVAGSVRHIKYGEGSPIVKTSKEKIEVVDKEAKTFGYSVIEGDLLKYYKTFKAHVTVVPKEDNQGSLVKWACEFEKTAEEIPDPDAIKEFAIKNFIELDDYLAKQEAAN